MREVIPDSSVRVGSFSSSRKTHPERVRSCSLRTRRDTYQAPGTSYSNILSCRVLSNLVPGSGPAVGLFTVRIPVLSRLVSWWADEHKKSKLKSWATANPSPFDLQCGWSRYAGR